MFQKIFNIEKILWIGGGWGITFFRRKILCLTVPKIFLGGPLYFRNVMVSNFFLIIGVPWFCRFFLSHTAENFRRGALLCFRMFRASKHFMPKRGISRLCLEKLLSDSTQEIRRWTLLSVTKWYPKNSWQRGGREYHIFLSKSFGLSAKKIVCEPFSVSLFSGIEKFYA